jgi:hypothetical protein
VKFIIIQFSPRSVFLPFKSKYPQNLSVCVPLPCTRLVRIGPYRFLHNPFRNPPCATISNPYIETLTTIPPPAIPSSEQILTDVASIRYCKSSSIPKRFGSKPIVPTPLEQIPDYLAPNSVRYHPDPHPYTFRWHGFLPTWPQTLLEIPLHQSTLTEPIITDLVNPPSPNPSLLT